MRGGRRIESFSQRGGGKRAVAGSRGAGRLSKRSGCRKKKDESCRDERDLPCQHSGPRKLLRKQRRMGSAATVQSPGSRGANVIWAEVPVRQTGTERSWWPTHPSAARFHQPDRTFTRYRGSVIRRGNPEDRRTAQRGSADHRRRHSAECFIRNRVFCGYGSQAAEPQSGDRGPKLVAGRDDQ